MLVIPNLAFLLLLTYLTDPTGSSGCQMNLDTKKHCFQLGNFPTIFGDFPDLFSQRQWEKNLATFSGVWRRIWKPELFRHFSPHQLVLLWGSAHSKAVSSGLCLFKITFMFFSQKNYCTWNANCHWDSVTGLVHCVRLSDFVAKLHKVRK